MEVFLKSLKYVPIVAILAIISFLSVGEPNNAPITIKNETITTETTWIKYSCENLTGKYTSGPCKVDKLEKNVDGEWVSIGYIEGNTEMAAHICSPFATFHGSCKAAESLTEGEYRLTVRYGVATKYDINPFNNDITKGYTSTTFTVTAAE